MQAILISFLVLTEFAFPHKGVQQQLFSDSTRVDLVINSTTIKRLGDVTRDLYPVLNDPLLVKDLFPGSTQFTIFLYDVTCNSFERVACIHRTGDAAYYLKLNRFNQKAKDIALAVTIIHEFMHCVLLDIDAKARQGNEKAIAIIEGLGLAQSEPSNFFTNEFFLLMNKGEEGQHELLQRFFFEKMVTLLKKFASIHKAPKPATPNFEHLVWSGLQNTNGYKNLGEEIKRDIETSILKAKGMDMLIE